VAGKTWAGAGCGTTWCFTSGWRCGVFATRPPARLPAWFTASVATSYQATHVEWLGGSKRTWILLASYSVARRAAPVHALRADSPYANELGQRLLEQHLDLVTADKGEIVTIYRPADDGVWMETMPLPTRFRESGPFRRTWTCRLPESAGGKLPSTERQRRSMSCRPRQPPLGCPSDLGVLMPCP